MSHSAEFVPLDAMGQRLRKQGLSLRLRQFRHAVSSGEVEGVRVGSRWLVREEDARRFAQPLDPNGGS